jgi:hypothetical protein
MLSVLHALHSMRVGNDLVDFGVFASITSTIIFVIGYSTFAKWWRTRWGKTTVSLDLCIGITLIPSAISLMRHIYINSSLFFTYYAGIALILVACSQIWRLFTVRRIHVEAQRAEQDNKQDKENDDASVCTK